MTRATEESPAIKACRELIYGDGTDASLQRAIDLARAALGCDARSILSVDPDAFGFHYGFFVHESGRQDPRRIDVQSPLGRGDEQWNAYVGGDLIGSAPRKAEAEAIALEFIHKNPVDMLDV